MRKKDILPASIGKRNKYSPSVMTQICDALRVGESLRAAATAAGVDPASVRRWIASDDIIRREYESARDKGLRFLMDAMLELCAEAREAALDGIQGRERMAAIKMQIDTYKWILCKRFPVEYGERQAVELTGKEGALLMPTIPEAERADLAAKIAAARAKIDTTNIPTPSDDALRRLAVMQVEAAAGLAERRRET